MVNLNNVANSNTKAINPNFPATLFVSTGHVQGPNFKPVPTYQQVAIKAQVQPLSSKDLRQLDALNIMGAEKSIYLNGAALGVIRIKQRGGDIIVFPPGTLPEGDTWLVLASLEQWPASNWAHIAAVGQDDVIVVTSPLSTDLTNKSNVIVVPATTGV